MFQNRRQIKRRKSRPLLPHEIAAFGLGINPCLLILHLQLAIVAVRNGGSKRVLCATRAIRGTRNDNEPGLSQDVQQLPAHEAIVMIKPTETNVKALKICPLKPNSPLSLRGTAREIRSQSVTEVLSQSFSATPGYLANRWNPVNPFSTPVAAPSIMFTTPAISRPIFPSSCPERSRPILRPLQYPAAARVMRELGNSVPKESPVMNSQLKAENESNGSAIAAISLIRSTSGSALKSNPSKRNTPSRPNPQGKRPKMTRASSGAARMQSGVKKPRKTVNDKDSLWRKRTRRPAHIRKDSEREPKSILQDNLEIPTHADFHVNKNMRRKSASAEPEVYEDTGNSITTTKTPDDDVQSFMRGPTNFANEDGMDLHIAANNVIGDEEIDPLTKTTISLPLTQKPLQQGFISSSLSSSALPGLQSINKAQAAVISCSRRKEKTSDSTIAPDMDYFHGVPKRIFHGVDAEKERMAGRGQKRTPGAWWARRKRHFYDMKGRGFTEEIYIKNCKIWDGVSAWAAAGVDEGQGKLKRKLDAIEETVAKVGDLSKKQVIYPPEKRIKACRRITQVMSEEWRSRRRAQEKKAGRWTDATPLQNQMWAEFYWVLDAKDYRDRLFFDTEIGHEYLPKGGGQELLRVWYGRNLTRGGARCRAGSIDIHLR
ncbi:hypothetical protein DID88_005084 [Monilinia fructigena]|uniref:Uncharacterized protein n=1 Tax=Monilinia fructigena TaxID=38457 RepID=A0A395IW03_9HELO|nr:hypothetical protein DID88_005084 [Monilinia fructigena]